jgi:hypothetical protein
MVGRIVFKNDGPVYYLDGQSVSQEEFDRAFPPVREVAGGPTSLTGTSPHASEALAVHPGQVQEAVESAKRMGVPTEFLPDGRPIMRSRAHQKAYLKAYGFKNRDGGYGD